MKKYDHLMLVLAFCFALNSTAQTKHSKISKFPNYKGLVMAGYQGWFRASKEGIMYPDENKMRIDTWPEVSEYQKTYPTGLKLADGKTARFFELR